jgi:hypothetical protein
VTPPISKSVRAASHKELARLRLVDELIDQHEGAGRQFLFERAARGERNKIGHASELKHIDIGAIGDVSLGNSRWGCICTKATRYGVA